MNGDPIAVDGTALNGDQAEIAVTDTESSNGVIHAIDGVLLPRTCGCDRHGTERNGKKRNETERNGTERPVSRRRSGFPATRRFRSFRGQIRSPPV
nr:fasciclin domain-containing protein [Natronomonas aquatica]